MSVLIVGSGPAALTLAYILDGHLPIYDHQTYGPHPDSELHRLLIRHANLFLAMQDQQILEYVQENLESFFAQDVLAANLLYDRLEIPEEANLMNASTMESRIKWVACPELKRPTRIVSDCAAGGQWTCTRVDHPDNRVLSYAEMLSLPGFRFSEHYLELNGRNPPDFYRPTRGEVSAYYQAYQDKFQLKITKGHVEDIRAVSGSGSGTSFRVTTDKGIFEAGKVVLASGITSEINKFTCDVGVGQDGATLIVGTGVSAADAVINTSGPVIHVYQWLDAKGSPTPLRRYPRKLYPEYWQVFERMRLRKGTDYTGLPNADILDVKNGRATIKLEDGTVVEPEIKLLMSRTGRTGSLGYAKHILPIPLDTLEKRTLRDLKVPLPNAAQGVWIIGSLSGDSLVRFLGGLCCLAGAQLSTDTQPPQSSPHSIENIAQH